MSRLSDIELFTTVIDKSSFTAAAKALNVSKAYVSQQLSNLEQRLNVRLLNRTTRRINLTEAGENYYNHAQKILLDLQELESSVTQHQIEPQGSLKIAIPSGMLGDHYLAPVIAKFQKKYPRIKIQLDSSIQRVDLIEESYDAAIRLGILPDSSFIARKIHHLKYHICASPEYIEKHGIPKNPKELNQHNCLLLNDMENKWRFQKDNKKLSVKVQGNYSCNTGYALMHTAIEGAGICRLPCFHAMQSIQDKQLVSILQDWQENDSAIWMVYPHRQLLPAKVSLLYEFIYEAFNPIPPWNIKD